MASSSRAIRSQNAEYSQATQHIAEIDGKVRAILNYILDHSAEQIPMKEKDLVTAAGDKADLKIRLQLVTELLAERFGIIFKPLNVSPKCYICISETPLSSIYELTAVQRPQYTLLTIILMYIFLRSNRVEDSKLYKLLQLLNINVDEEHGYFGSNLRKLIEETFVKQQYLKRERSQLSAYDDYKTFYQWGLRAKAEFTYEQIVQFASQLLNQDPRCFNHQLAMAAEFDNAAN